MILVMMILGDLRGHPAAWLTLRNQMIVMDLDDPRQHPDAQKTFGWLVIVRVMMIQPQ